MNEPPPITNQDTTDVTKPFIFIKGAINRSSRIPDEKLGKLLVDAIKKENKSFSPAGKFSLSA
jgi:hypothetical protein